MKCNVINVINVIKLYKIGSIIKNRIKLYDVLSIMWNVIKKDVYDNIMSLNIWYCEYNLKCK